MATATREEIFDKVQNTLVDALGVDAEEVKGESTLTGDLGAESIDFLDIGFRLEQAFGFKIAQGELFPDNVQQDPRYVKDGKVTPEGLAALKGRLPHFNFVHLEKDPQLAKVAEIFTVDALVRFVERKLAA
jgi:acyl carrier protein